METVQIKNSSQIDKVSYNADTKYLFVTFTNGKRYSYKDVPENVFKELVSAESVGSYFIKNIKTKYQYEQLN